MNFFPLILSVLLIVFGLWQLWEFIRSWIKDFQPNQWQKTTAHILRSELETVDNTRDSLPGSLKLYSVLITYKYRVDGQAYVKSEGGRYGLMPEDRAHAIAKHYRRDDEITVYYHPDDPDHATMFNQPEGSIFKFMLAIFAFFAGFALLMGILFSTPS